MQHARRWLGLVSLVGWITGCGTIVVESVPQGTTTPADGVIYALPTTVVRIQLKVDRIEKSGAPYARFAAIFAPDGKPVCPDQECPESEKVAFSIESHSTLSTYGEPDSSEVFLVKFTGQGAIDQSLSMTWNEAGLLSAASSTVTNRSIDIATSGIKALTSLGVKFAGGAAAAVGAARATCPVTTPTDSWVLPILQRAPDPHIAGLLVDNFCQIKPATRAAWIDDAANRQLLTAALGTYLRFVQPLANARANILDGSSNSVDQANLLSRLDTELDAALTKYFIGKSSTQAWAGTLDTREILGNSLLPLTLPLLKLDGHKGICLQKAALPPDAPPIPKGFLLTSADCNNASDVVNLEVDYYPGRSKQLFTKMADVTTGKRSFRYRIPAQVAAVVSDGHGGSSGAAVLSIAQLGTVISLPAARHSKSLTYELGFIEATGALKSFKLGTTGGLDSSTIDALSGAAGTVADARNAERKSQQDLAVLTQQDQLLKLRDDICTIQKKYGITCTVAP